MLSDLEQELQRLLMRMGKGEDLAFFVHHMLTKSESIMLGRRIRIAKRLLAGRNTSQIRSEFNVGLATISSVESWVQRLPASVRKLLES